MKGQSFIFTLFICLFAITAMNAQEEKAEKNGGLFVRANVGYGFQAGGNVQGVDATRDYNKNIYGSTASGMNVGFGVGYMFNKYIGIELGGYYTFGTAKFSEVESEALSLGLQAAGTELNVLNAYIFEEYTHTSKQFRITPSIIIKGGSGKFVPYAKFGMLIPVAGKTSTDVVGKLSSDVIPTSISIPILGDITLPGFDAGGVSLQGSVDAEAESFGQFSLGFEGTLGAEMKINDMISVFGEVNFSTLHIKSKETKVLKYDGVYSLNGSPLSIEDLEGAFGFVGIDVSFSDLGLYENISEVPTSEAHFIYVDELNSNTNNPVFNDNFDANQAEDRLARKENNSSIGINIGVKFNF
jgi:hypothetical protein